MFCKYKYNELIPIILLFVLAGCHTDFTDEENSSQEKQLPSGFKVVSIDSFPEPAAYKSVIQAPQPARIIKQFEVSNNRLESFSPRKFPVKTPEKRTPGQGKYLLPEKVPAQPLTGNTPFPQVSRLKEPISIGNNPYSFMTYTKIQGLSHDDVMTFTEDTMGNLWIGTFGGGLMRFDGENISWYTNTPWGEIPEIISIQSDKHGGIWIATIIGLYYLDGKEIHYFNADTGGLLKNEVEHLQIDINGNVWISYWEGGISMYDGKYFFHYGTDQGISSKQGQIVKTDPWGNVWITCSEEGLFLYREGSFYLYEVPFVSSSHPILALGLGEDKDIWLSLYDLGVARFDGNQFFFYTLDDGFPSREIYQIEKDAQNRIWFATWGKGLIRWDKENFEIFDKEQGLSSQLINGIFIDSKNVLWTGFTGGMARYQGDIFQHFTTQQAFDNQTTSMTLGSDGKLWLSSYGGGLKSFDGKKFTQITPDKDTPDVFIEGLTADSKGNLWMSINQQGIYRFDGTHFYHHKLDSLKHPLLVEAGMEDSKGNIWLLIGKQGVLKYDGQTFRHYTTENGLPENYARAITEDSRGNIILATFGGGVVVMNDQNYTYITEADGLAGNYLFSAMMDSEDNLWFGSNGKGLSMYNGENFINFATTHGLTDNFIFSMTQDAEENLIFGGRFGLNVMSAQTLKELSEKSDPAEKTGNELHFFTKHTYEDGYLGIGSNLGMMKEKEGKIWIGSNNRLTLFHSTQSFIDTIPPHIAISGVDLFNEKINWKALSNRQDTFMLLANGVSLENLSFDNLSPWFFVPENLHLSHNNNFVTFHFSGISPHSGSKLLYSYKLEGFDKHWHKPSSENYAHYGNLPPGNYTLRARVMNKMGLWSGEERYSFVILTPWWKSWWAFAMYLIIAVTTLMLYIRSREKTWVLKNKILDNEVELARKTIEIKQNIIANVSHELRTPLTGIIGLTDILAKTPLNQQQKEYILTLQQTGINLKEIINQILDYSKIESGEVSLSQTTFSVDELFSHAKKVFDSLKQSQSQICIKTHIASDVPSMLLADRGRVNQILLNLLYNAVKFTPKGSITLEARVLDAYRTSNSSPSEKNELQVKISVTDTGVGISEEAIKKLFVPFSQIENNDTRETDSTGLGLAISKKLAHLLKGNIGVESQPGKGSRFWFTFRAEIPDNSNNAVKMAVPGCPGKNKKILLVEDKKVNQLVIKLLLKGMGHKVVIAENGEVALKLFQPGKFDYILMDIQMPVMDGITATQKLKETYSNPPPIIGLSANAFEGDREKYMSLGMDEYITKPVNEESLGKVFATVDFKE